MRAGALRAVAELYQRSNTGDQYSTSGGWELIDSDVRVDVRPLFGRESRAKYQSVSEATVEVVMRFRPDVTSASRLKIEGITYHVVYPLNVGNRRRELRLACKVVE